MKELVGRQYNVKHCLNYLCRLKMFSKIIHDQFNVKHVILVMHNTLFSDSLLIKKTSTISVYKGINIWVCVRLGGQPETSLFGVCVRTRVVTNYTRCQWRLIIFVIVLSFRLT